MLWAVSLATGGGGVGGVGVGVVGVVEVVGVVGVVTTVVGVVGVVGVVVGVVGVVGVVVEVVGVVGVVVGGKGGGLDSDEAKTRSKRTKEQVQAKNRIKNNTFQSDTLAGRRIVSWKSVIERTKASIHPQNLEFQTRNDV